MTDADRVAKRFDFDGQKFTVEVPYAGKTNIWRAIESTGGLRVSFDGIDRERYEFRDGSSLVICGDCWDLGFPGHLSGCYCMAESNQHGHTENCPHHGY